MSLRSAMDVRRIETFLVVSLSIFALHVTSGLLDPSLIGVELQKFARDALGVEEMQNYLDGLQYHERTIRGEVITPELAVKLSDKFKVRFEVAKRLQKAVEESYARTESVQVSPQKECCMVNKSSLKYDVRFRSKVDMDNVCLKISGSAQPNPRYLDEGVVSEMKDISRTSPFIKWQYFGSEEGVMTNFPVYDDKDPCDRYDPRFRPFYVETATPEAKDVVLVIDTSASMDTTKLTGAIQAANTVLETMNPKDQIGIVSFNDDVSTPGELGIKSPCYSERLAQAIPTNIEEMKRYVRNLIPHGSTNYKQAFKKAFSLLKNSISGEERKGKKRVILFLTDGAPADPVKDIFQTIRDENFALNNSVVILTYGFGEADSAILEDIAIQNTPKYGIPANVSVGDITPGRYKFVQDINNLRGEMAKYYNLFSLGIRFDPVVSVPYIDAFGTGLLMSITLPCFHNGEFIGVTGTDINIEDLLSDITFFNQGQSTYAFMITNSGRTLIHPLLPEPTHAYGEPVYLDIRALEPEKDFIEVFESIQKRIGGSKTYVAKRFLPRGGTEKEGVTMKEVNTTYFWTPIEDIDFSLGVVVPVSHSKDELSSPSISSGYKFDYHRIDLYNPGNLCSHFGITATKDTTVVKFAPGAYKDPYNYIGMDETKADVELLNAYMKDETGRVTNPGLKNDIRGTVRATWKVEDLWLREKTDLTQYLVWRYIGTSNGVFRFTPGTIENKLYDPRQRPWYLTALSHTGLIALTTPYFDLGGAGVVITAGRTLYRGESSHVHSTNDEVLGVMGADFPITYFHRLLTDVYPKCKETKSYSCFVMDSAGFLIMHEDFLLPSATASDVQYVHITEKEKHIAEDLIKKNYLIKKQCRHLDEIQKQSFYEVNLTKIGVDTLASDVRCSKYQLRQIKGTNSYLGVAIRDSFCPPEACPCSSDNECFLLNPTCECPCTSRLEFHYCRNLFPESSLPICPPPLPSAKPMSDSTPSFPCTSGSGLEKCFIPHCGERNTSQECEGVVGCYWCKHDKDDIPLIKPYCAAAEVCFRGKEVEQRVCPTDLQGPKPSSPIDRKNSSKLSDDDDSNQLSSGAIAGIVTGCLSALAVVVIVSILALRHFRSYSQPPTRKDTSASTEYIIDPENHENTSNITKRPPAPLPPEAQTQSSDFDEYYEEPDDLRRSHQASVDSTPWPAPYEEIRVRESSKPPPTPERKLSTVTTQGFHRTTSLPPSTNDGRGKTLGNHSVARTVSTSATHSSGARFIGPIKMHSIESRLPEIPEKRRPSVIPPPPSISAEKLSMEDKPPQTVSPIVHDNQERPYGNISQMLPAQNHSLATSALSSTDDTATQDTLHEPNLQHRDSGGSISLDPDGYIEFTGQIAAVQDI